MSAQSPLLTLSKAMDVSDTGDTINAASGVYTGDNNVGLTISSRTIVGASSTGTVFQGDDDVSVLFYTSGDFSFENLTLKGGHTGLNPSGTLELDSVVFTNSYFAIELNIGLTNFTMTGCLFDHTTSYGLKFISSSFFDWENIIISQSKFYSSLYAVYIDSTSTADSSQFRQFVFSKSIATASVYLHWINGAESTTFSASDFSNCTASQGAALAISARSAFTISDCSFTDNSASNRGGAIYFDHSSTTTSASLVIDRSVFTGNSASSGQGGAVYANGVDLNVTRSIFIGNSAGTAGGAVFLSYYTGTETTCRFHDNMFYANAAEGSGGAITISTTGIPGSITATSFLFNEAGLDGTVSLNYGDLSLAAVTFIGNHASASGGGVYLNPSSTMTASLVSFLGNTASDGGAVFLDDGGTFTSTSSVMANNTATSTGGAVSLGSSTLSMQYATIYGNVAGTGGGFYSDESAAVSIFAAIIKSNSASVSGGGYFCNGGGVNLGYTSILHNTAPVGSAYTCEGDCSTYMTSSFVAKDNTASGCGSDFTAVNAWEIEEMVVAELVDVPIMTIEEATQLGADYRR
eukprot:CAMPEP_0114626020 /NCGR_PEP_ID=MMETSP0168-20121206/11565_1 /TAXON_ID=95228 ORGANISM="Vannella sp., Strain DIVA3 517/6/12" /NCGR_SAMPLE_ID=MMETSP0168 /ASSEMBLY_ACC=CAM_ASM_000044 /LENGTH=576 /DNA_ID=CAMNT_0001837309 /DNA_START=42 /DNA_END=1772 /DNA_ORIENTATION=+